jgi:hypothetical protein
VIDENNAIKTTIATNDVTTFAKNIDRKIALFCESVGLWDVRLFTNLDHEAGRAT